MKITSFILVAIVVPLGFLLPSATSFAQEFELTSFSVSGGGGFGVGGLFEIESTIGQLDASEPMSGGGFSMTGGFWSPPASQDVVEVVATSLDVTRGTFISGPLSYLSLSDNLDLRIVRSNTDVQSRTEFELTATSPTSSPETMQVQLEGSVFSRTQVNQIIELFNYRTNSWEQVDIRPAARFADSTTTIDLTGAVGRFVEPRTNSVDARIRYLSLNPRQVFTSNTDQFLWLIQ